jgi:alkaline phosphatase
MISRKTIFVILLLFNFLFSKNVIMFVSDGTGTTCFTIAREIKGSPLFIDKYLKGSSITKSNDNLVTESAIAATTLATGVKSCG